MNKLIMHLLTVLLVALGLQLNAVTITSKTTGGQWSSTSTWVGGVVPGASHNVVIAGAVTVYGQSCNDITINTGSSLTNRGGYGVILVVNGDLTNNGTLQTSSSGGYLYMQLFGDLTNNGTYKPFSTTFKGTAISHVLKQTGNVAFEGRYHTIDTASSLVFGSYVKFSKAVLDGYAHYTSNPYFAKIKTTGYNAAFIECEMRDFRIESSDTIDFDKSDLYLIQTFNHIKVKGIFAVYDNVHFNGALTNLGTIQNRGGYANTLNINGNFINKGAIKRNLGGGYFYLKFQGDIHNEGEFNPTSTVLKKGNKHKLSQSAGKYFEGTWTTEDTLSGIVLGSFIEFRKANVDGYFITGSAPYFAKIETNGHNLFFNECVLREFRIESNDTIDLDKSDVTLVHFFGNYKTKGTFSVYDNNYLNGTWTNLGKTYNRGGYSNTLNVQGKFINKGQIRNHPGGGSLYLELNSDLENQSVYAPRRTTILKDKTVTLSQSINKVFEGEFYLVDTSSSIISGSDLYFDKVYIHGAYVEGKRSPIVTNGYDLTFDTCTLYTLDFSGVDALSLDASDLLSVNMLGNLTLEGTFSIYDYVISMAK